MRKLVIIFLIAISTFVQGQQLNFIQIDTTTYHQYLREEWKDLILFGEKALNQGTDYYYLQMRMAYSYFALGKYRQAITYYKNALKFNRYDPIANEYLYYSYKFSGRENDAVAQITSLTNAQKLGMKLNDSSKLISIGLSYSNASSNAELIKDAVVAGITTLDGVQKAAYTLHSPAFSLSHRLSNQVIADHKLAYINKNELSYLIYDRTEYISPEQPLKQIEYSLNLSFTPIEGLIIKPGLHFLTSRIPLYAVTEYGNSAGRDRIKVSELRINNIIPKIQIEKKMTFFDAGVSFVHHNFNQMKTNQFGFHTTIYPLANLNLYGTLDAYLSSQTFIDTSARNVVIKPLIGFKLHKNFWMEVSATFPEHFNFYDVRNTIAYNTIEKTASSLEVLGIIPLYRSGIKLYIGYQNQSVNSYYFPSADMLAPINKQSYTNHLITGGIKWTM